MKVHGFEVTPEIEQACLVAMVGVFDHIDVWRAGTAVGMPEQTNICCALIQRERKAGRIKRVGNRWERVEETK